MTRCPHPQFLAALFLSFVAAVRYFSMPQGQAILRKMWRRVSTTRTGQQIFYVTK
jgi:hypothetical protein